MSRKIFITDDMGLDDAIVDIAAISPESAMLWPWILPYFDDWGRAEASPRRIKGKIFPLFDHVTVKAIEAALGHFSEAGIVVLYEVGGTQYMCIDPMKWFAYQTHIHKDKRVNDGSKIPACPLFAHQESAPVPPVSAQSRETPRDSAQSRASPSPSPSLSLSPSPKEEEDTTAPREARSAAGEALRPVADTQAGAIFPPDRPLPLLVQDFIQAKAGADAPRWEAELRLKLECKPLTGPPDSYMLGVLRGWVRDGGPPQPTPQRAQGGPRLTAAEERDARLKAERDADFEQMAEVERRLFADPWAVQEPEPPSLPAGRVRVSDAAFVRPTAPQGRRTGGLLQ